MTIFAGTSMFTRSRKALEVRTVEILHCPMHEEIVSTDAV
jgi:hypothetical protein